MADKRRALGIVHRVGHVAHEHHVFAVARHLPQSEWPTQHAHVGVYADQDHVANFAVLHHAPDFRAAIANIIGIMNLQTVHLFLPGRPGVAAAGLEFLGPFLVLHRIIILAAIRLIDWILAGFLRRNLFAPKVDVFGQRLGLGRIQHVLARRMIFVGLHTTARRVDDRKAQLAGGLDHLVHTRRQFPSTARGIQAMMQIPHVANDNG